MLMNERIKKDSQKMKSIIMHYMKKNDIERALKATTFYGRYMYLLNQCYCDDYVEEIIGMAAQNIGAVNQTYEKKANSILFYDGFGLDNRGLALIYVKALVNLQFDIVYVTLSARKNFIPGISKELDKNKNNKMIFISEKDIIQSIKTINCIVEKENVSKIILYTTPYDLIGITACTGLEGRIERYLINLTDHAFWLGKRSSDYFIEFRDYGASVSFYKRKITENRIIKLPFYPMIDDKAEFQGFPFQCRGKKVVFSGGSLYKTLGADNLYYKIVNHILKRHSDVIFLYAGTGDGRELKKLQEKFPERVYWIPERSDLFAVMKNVTLYLSTYPMIGGLMSQYAIAANTLPITLIYDECSTGVLLRPEELNIEFTSENEMISMVDHLLDDDVFLQQQKNKINHQLILPEEFEEQLLRLFTEKKTKFHINKEDFDTSSFLNTYIERINYMDYCKLFGIMKIKVMWRWFPKYTITGIMGNIKEKINHK